MPDDTTPTVADVWAAIHTLIEPHQHHLQRTTEEAHWLDEATQQLTQATQGHNGTCNIPTYRRATATKAAAETHTGTIPSLWDQSTTALTGGETSNNGAGTKPLRERSPADLDLIEIRTLIRDTTRTELHKRGHHTPHQPDGTPTPFTTTEIHTLAQHVTTENPDQLWWWEYRFAQWSRLLENYLHIAEHKAKPVRLRNTACPRCDARQYVTDDDEPMVVPALIVDFSPDGYVRACECLNCGMAWFRGEQLEQLAAEIGAQGGRMTA